MTSGKGDGEFCHVKIVPKFPVPFGTEQGIAMLSGLLKNDIAIQVSINIMNAFVEIRKFLMLNGQVFERLTRMEYKLLEHDKKFDEVFNQLQFEQKVCPLLC